MQLTNEEINQFHTLGYVVKPAVFTQADLQPIKVAINETVDAKARQLHAAGQLADLCADAPFETRLAAIQAVDEAAAQAIVQHLSGKGGGGYSGPAMLAMLRHAPLLDCITSLIGPDIVGSSVYRIRPKLPLWTRGEVPWHQDSGYFLPHCDTHLIVTCWVPLGRCRSGKWLSLGLAEVAPDWHPDPPSGRAWRLSGNCGPRPATD